jgi:hypothetical protein
MPVASRLSSGRLHAQPRDCSPAAGPEGHYSRTQAMSSSPVLPAPLAITPAPGFWRGSGAPPSNRAPCPHACSEAELDNDTADERVLRVTVTAHLWYTCLFRSSNQIAGDLSVTVRP